MILRCFNSENSATDGRISPHDAESFVYELHKWDYFVIDHAPQRFVLAGKPNWKLQVLPSLTESCDFQHGIDGVTGNPQGLGEWWKEDATLAKAEETPPQQFLKESSSVWGFTEVQTLAQRTIATVMLLPLITTRAKCKKTWVRKMKLPHCVKQ